MAIIKKFEPKRVFISNRLNNRLKTIYDSTITIVEAPVGYGKTTIVKEFLQKSTLKIIWFNIYSEDKDSFITDLSNRLESISTETAKSIRNIGFPNDDKSYMMFVTALFEMKLNEDTVLVFDNYHLIRDDFLNKVVMDLSAGKNEKLKIVFLTQDIKSNITLDFVLKRRINHINKSDFELNKDEINDYFKLCGIKLEIDEIDFLYEYTEGWISALYLQMLSYVSRKKFEPSIDVEKLINKAIYKHLNRKEQDFLITISVFECVSFRQAIAVSGNALSENDIDNMFNNNGFINYYSKTRKYYIHPMLKLFLEQEFEKQELTFKKSVYKRAGDWYRDNEEYYNAIVYYHKIKDYDSILGMDYTLNILVKEMNNSNMDLFLSVIKKISTIQKKNNLKSYMILLFALFVYNKKDLLRSECKLIEKIIDGIKDIKEDWYEYKGEYDILNAFTKFNNLDEMYEAYDSAYNTLGISSKLYEIDNNILQYNPSIVSLFHYELGKLDNELNKIDKLMPLYYKLFDGASKGAEALMRAEILLNRCEFKDASLLCKKAMYMAETRNQMDIYVAAVFNLARIAYFESDYENINKLYNDLKEKLNCHTDKELLNMNDMCESYLRISLDTPLMVKHWLTDYSTIECNCRIYNLGFANVVYGKYLIQNEKYEDLLAITGEMLNVAGIFNSILFKIYTYIYISICNYYLFNNEKSVRFIEEAIKLADADNIFIPFVENYGILNDIFINLEKEKYNSFIEKVKKVSKKYSKNLNALKKAAISEQSYGLTKRETDVAKLAARRYSNKEIAEQLFIAESTVKSNLKVIYSKLGINSRNELKRYFEE